MTKSNRANSPRSKTNSDRTEHLSLFRYPGGKSWLVPYIHQWLLDRSAGLFVEPFAGGAAISLAVARNRWARHVLMCEIDAGVAAVWNSALNGEADWLRNRITAFKLTKRNLAAELSSKAQDQKKMAFRTLLRNRTSHGGLLTQGSASLNRGEDGKGIRSRWYPETLASRLNSIKAFRQRITFVEGDGVQLLESLSKANQCFFFLDPPYTAGSISAGARMYEHHTVDHARLFSIAKRMSGDFLMSYDDTPEIRLMARAHGFQIRRVGMRTRHHVATEELLICRDFDWFSRTTTSSGQAKP